MNLLKHESSTHIIISCTQGYAHQACMKLNYENVFSYSVIHCGRFAIFGNVRNLWNMK